MVTGSDPPPFHDKGLHHLRYTVPFRLLCKPGDKGAGNQCSGDRNKYVGRLAQQGEDP